VFEHWAGWDWAESTRRAGWFRGPIEAFRPHHVEELLGIAEGAGVAFEDVLALNVRTELMFAGRGQGQADAAFPLECSAFAIVPRGSDGGHILVGQNWDWLLHSAETVIVLHVQRDDGPDFVTVVEAGMLAKCGFNASGVGLMTNALVSDEDVGTPAIPYHVVLRAILDADSVAEAAATISGATRSSSANYLLADRSGAALDVEAAPGDGSRLATLMAMDGVLVHTNHFVSPSLVGEDLTLALSPSSPIRLERLRVALVSAPSPRSVDVVQRALADHADDPMAVCGHPDPARHPLERTATIASVIVDLDRQRMWVAEGPACGVDYRPLDLETRGETQLRPQPEAGN
jgi:isopenicillin-N N-acyltransferase-like protein